MSRSRNIAHAASLALLMAAAPAAHAQTGHGDHGAAQHAEMSAASQAYMDAMARMNDGMEAMEMTGRPGVDFALMMIPHHQSAIDMAKAYLESGENDAELVKLSQEIVAAQESEIAYLRDWLARNGQ